MQISKKLAPYTTLADMVADSFGKKCEVIIHDLMNPESSVVYVTGHNITNRQVGQSFDHLVKDVLLSKNFKNDYNANYTFTADNGARIKSSTSLIRDENGEVIGSFCINIEVDDMIKMRTFLSDFLDELDAEDPSSIAQTNDFSNVIEIIDDLIDKTIGNIDVTSLKRKDNIRLISFMQDKGIFLTKGSVEKVAEKLQISPVTVYSYLDAIKKANSK